MVKKVPKTISIYGKGKEVRCEMEHMAESDSEVL